MKILFVCLGNICRSPLAEAIFVHQIREMSLDGRFTADSCGTAGYHIGDDPDPRTIRVAAENGIEIHHSGRQLDEADLDEFDLILAMDHSNYSDILHLKNANQHASKIHLMRDFDVQAGNKDVPDPYYGGMPEFRSVFEILDRSIDGLMAHLNSNPA